MDTTTHLNLPYLIAAQAQKHVTHNEALRALDAVVQLAVRDRERAVPPASPADGDRYIIAAAPAGDWSDKAGHIAAFQDNAWMFYRPEPGWLCWIEDESQLAVWSGAAWTAVSGAGASLNPAPLVGVNTTADAANRLAVKSDAVLFSHDDVTPGTGSVQHKLNKAAAANTASFLFQEGYSGCAELGLCGDDDLHVKVSTDGAAWREALIADRATGAVRFPNGLLDATTMQKPALLLPTTVRDIWRSDIDAPATPRNYSIGAISGDTVTIATSEVEQFFNAGMQNVSTVRLWNISKSPAQAAWVDWNLAANAFRVSDAAHVAGWLPGETLRLGDPSPTGTNALQMVAIDISRHLQAAHGTVFRQRGLKISVAPQGVGGRVGMDCSGTGAVGTAFGLSSNSDGARQSAFIDVFTTELSPISNSNLLFVREALSGGTAMAATRLFRLVGVWV